MSHNAMHGALFMPSFIMPTSFSARYAGKVLNVDIKLCMYVCMVALYVCTQIYLIVEPISSMKQENGDHWGPSKSPM